MKKVSYFLPAFALMALASCTSNEEPIGAASQENEIKVATDVTARTRAGYTTENLREFGLIIASGNADYTYNNQKMTGGPLEGWSSDKVMYWEGQNKEHTILAYAPYKDATLDANSIIDVKIGADQSTADAVQASDFIAMKKSGFVPANDLTDGKLLVKMNHLLAKVYVSITYPEAYVKADGVNPVANVGIDGMKLQSKLDFAAWDGTVEHADLALNANSESETIAPYELSHDAATRTVVYEYIAVPQEQTNIGVKFTAGGTPYLWKYDNLKLVAGQSLTIKLSVDKQGVQLGGDVTVGEWFEGDDINGGQPSEGADPWKIEQLTNIDQWNFVYTSCGTPWQHMSELKSDRIGTFGAVDGFNGAASGMFNKFYVVDLGASYWIAGAGIKTGFADCAPKQCNIYVTNDNYNCSLISDEIKAKLWDNDTEAYNNDDEYRATLKTIDDYNKTINWTKVFTLNTTLDASGNDWDTWHDKTIFNDFEEAELLKEIKGRYVLVEVIPYSPSEKTNGYINIGLFRINKVSERNGVKVD